MDYQRLLIDHFDLIQQIVRSTGRRRHMSLSEQDDFSGFVHLRLLDNDYAVLKKFQGRSSLQTFLAAVIDRLAIDFRTDRWGRWRPSKMAERVGAVAVLFERLVNRDGHTVDEAMELLRSSHGVSLSFTELRAIWEQLPVRSRTTEVGEEAAATVASSDTPEAGVQDAARKQDIERLERALKSALKKLPSRDRVIIALRFDHDMPIAEIARVTASSVATVHRRIDRCLHDLRAALSAFDSSEILAVIGDSTVYLPPLLRKEVEKFLRRGRLYKRDG